MRAIKPLIRSHHNAGAPSITHHPSLATTLSPRQVPKVTAHSTSRHLQRLIGLIDEVGHGSGADAVNGALPHRYSVGDVAFDRRLPQHGLLCEFGRAVKGVMTVRGGRARRGVVRLGAKS